MSRRSDDRLTFGPREETRYPVVDLDQALENAASRQLLRPAQDFLNGKLSFGLLIDGKRFILFSDKEHLGWNDAMAKFCLADFNFSKSKFSTEGIRRFRRGDSVSASRIFTDLRGAFQELIVFPSRAIPSVLALWIMGTYLYSSFRWFPYLWLNSPTRRSGKTLLLSIIDQLAFNSTSTSSSSESWLFREVSANGSTLLLDEMENLRSQDKEKFSGIMAMLNAGFKKGSTVGRIEKVDRSYKPVDFHVYSPKCLAGINKIADTVQDRCLKIILLRKKKAERIARINHGWEEKFLQLRDDLHIFALNSVNKINQFYQDVDVLRVPDRLDDRAKDILEPLFAIAAFVDWDLGSQASASLRDFCAEQESIRANAEAEDESIVAVVGILAELEIGDQGIIILTPDDLLNHFQKSQNLSWIQNKKQAGSMMTKLGFKSKPHRVSGNVVRGYRVSRTEVDDLTGRYLSPVSMPDNEAETVTSVTSEGNPFENPSVTEPRVTIEKLVGL